MKYLEFYDICGFVIFDRKEPRLLKKLTKLSCSSKFLGNEFGQNSYTQLKSFKERSFASKKLNVDLLQHFIYQFFIVKSVITCILFSILQK